MPNSVGVLELDFLLIGERVRQRLALLIGKRNVKKALLDFNIIIHLTCKRRLIQNDYQRGKKIIMNGYL